MRFHSGLILLTLLAPSLFAQQPQSQTQAQTPRQPQPRQFIPRDGGVSEVLQSIYIPPLLNAPFTAFVQTEWAKPIGDGGTITLVNQRRVARDSRGRIYEERWLLVPKDGETRSRMNVIQIADPVAHTLYNCFILRVPLSCTLETFAEPAVTTFTPHLGFTGPLPNNLGSSTHENLGPGSSEGVETVGSRDTILYNPHAIGNDRQFSATREFWQATSLGVNLISIVDDPRIGKQTFTLTDVIRADPDPKLFEIPEGYSVVDRRKTTE
jgi:hypothetical protein